jgi:hypothetical protein
MIASDRFRSRLFASPLFWRLDQENRMVANASEPANKDS